MNNNKTQNQNDNRSEQEANLALMEARVKKLTTRLRAGLFLLFAMLIAGALFFANVYYERLALALTGNYTMTSGDLLTAGDWNTLADDFVSKDEYNGLVATINNMTATVNNITTKVGNIATFIDPVSVNTGGAVAGWTTFDASPYIPADAVAVILEAEAAMTGPDGGDKDAYIRIRESAGSFEYVLLRGRSAGERDNVAWASQGIFPVGNDKKFQWEIEAPGFNEGAVIRLIGYY